jgi:hypothetical protein
MRAPAGLEEVLSLSADNPRLAAAIRHALRVGHLRRLGEDETVALVMAAMAKPSREQMMAELAVLGQQGKGRQAISIVARRHADPGDPRAIESLKRKLRDWRQKNGKSPFVGSEVG